MHATWEEESSPIENFFETTEERKNAEKNRFQ